MNQIKVGAIVRPKHNGEDQLGKALHWRRLRGRVVDVWIEGGFDAWEGRSTPVITKVQVHWFNRAPYPTRLETDWLELA